MIWWKQNEKSENKIISTNTQKVNNFWFTVFPKFASQLGQSFSAFKCTLLDLKKKSKVWKLSTAHHEFQKGWITSHSILMHLICPIPESAAAIKSEKFPKEFQELYLQDPSHYGFTESIFSWQNLWDLLWNQCIVQFICTNWKNSNQSLII